MSGKAAKQAIGESLDPAMARLSANVADEPDGDGKKGKNKNKNKGNKPRPPKRDANKQLQKDIKALLTYHMVVVKMKMSRVPVTCF